MKSGELTCRLTILRPGAGVDDGLQTQAGAEVALDQRPWSKRLDVSDVETVRAGMVLGSKITRFQLRATDFSAKIRITDLIQADGLTYDISGIKQIADRDIEITAVARVDGP